MAHGNRSAIYVDRVVRNLHVTHIAKHDARKSFVQFEEVNVLFCHARDLQGFLANCGSRGQHDRRLRTDVGISANASARFKTRLFTKLLGTNEHQPSPVTDARAVAAVMNVKQILNFGVEHFGDRLKTALRSETLTTEI